jgi:hypothetical protein
MDSSFSVLVTNLNVANMLMGVYCGIIAGADEVFRGSFVHKERAWAESMTCQVAGFLYLLSTEVSSLTVVIITWDQISQLSSWPSLSHLQFAKRSSSLACVVVWAVGVTLSAIFIFPTVSTWATNRRSATCIPVQAGGKQGSYSVVMLAGVRSLLLLLVSAGQGWLCWCVHQHKSSLETADFKNLRLARQFKPMAVTDCCATLWSVMSGVVLSEEISSALAILLQPINAALNPCLFLIKKVLDDHRQQQEARLMQLLKSRLMCKQVR